MRKFLIKLFFLLILCAPLGMVTAVVANYYVWSQKTYKFRAMFPLQMPELPTILTLHDELLVRRVSHEADGALCFIQVTNNVPGCVKFQYYYLTETEVK